MIECINASFGYEGKAVVSELNFKISKGDYLCIIGENGSGKSTLLKGITGLLTPVDGEIRVSADKNDIGYLSQNVNAGEGFPASVKEVVMSGFCGKIARFFYSKSQKQLALDNMELMKISHLSEKNISELSGGQKQRVYLARALCAGSGLLILDEPASSLDANSAKELYSAAKLVNDSGVTVIMVSHDETALRYASHVLKLENRQQFFGKVSDAEGGDCHE